MAVALLLFILFLLIARIGRNIFGRLFQRTSNNKALQGLFETTTYYSILGLGIFIILSVLKLNQAVSSLLAGVGVVGLALGFAFQNIAANFVSGIILAFRAPFKIGEIVEVNDIMGKVYNTDLRVTTIETFQGQRVFVPNKEVLQNPIVNYSKLGKRRIDLEVGVSYAEDLRLVERVVVSTIKSMEGVIDHDKMVFDYSGFGDSSINFNIRFWITYPDEPGFLEERKKAIIAIKEAFDENSITIPFPIRTLDFGIKGGIQFKEQAGHLLSLTNN